MEFLLLIIILGLLVGIYYIVDYFDELDTKISIKESLDLANLPVITFINNDTKFNFLLDTGSTQSHIIPECIKYMTGESSKFEQSFINSNSSFTITELFNTQLQYKDSKFEVSLYINPGLTESLIKVKQNFGVTIHGMLGSDFLQKYKYILDFNKCVVYNKKSFTWKR